MKKMTIARGASRESTPVWDSLETFARTHVQGFIQQLLEDEVTELLGRAKSERRGTVDAQVGSRNGHGKPRQLALMNGTVTVRRPRVRDVEERFRSRLLPLFQRRTPEVSALLPELYLHGLALGDFELALRGLLGDAAPLSASSLVRLKASWQAQYAAWQQRDLSDLKLVYLWADGVYVKAGLEDGKAALLVVLGADAHGQKHVLAVASGQRESTESWAAVLRDLKRRGLRAPKLTIADGHLGIWGALAAVYPASAEQRC
ncbi:MAG: transposase [Gemmatimonadetes bacterium]|nr:transposase [Gemmatimonadota bacterium]